MDKQPTMYLVVNRDLKLSMGQTAAQIAHIVQSITEEIIRSAYENYPVPESYVTYMQWRPNAVVIVKKATEEQLIDLKQLDNSRSFDDVVYHKKSNTKSDHLTVVGFLPSCDLDELMKKYDLL